MTVGHTEQQLMDLAAQLLASTQKGSLEWIPSDDTSTSFQTARRSGSVEITSDDKDGAFPYTLTVYDSGGRRVESLTTGYFMNDAGLSAGPREWNELWKQLYEAARGRALNIDTVIRSLIDELKADDIPF
jgi:hypothetical protein